MFGLDRSFTFSLGNEKKIDLLLFCEDIISINL